MSAVVPQNQQVNLDRYVVVHVSTTCDEHGVYVTKDSAEVIELAWVLLDAKSCEEVSFHPISTFQSIRSDQRSNSWGFFLASSRKCSG